MKKILLLILIGSCAGLLMAQDLLDNTFNNIFIEKNFEENQIRKNFTEQVQGHALKTYDLFEYTIRNTNSEYLSSDYTLSLKNQAFSTIQKKQPSYFRLRVPVGDQYITLDLYQHDLFSDGFQFKTASGKSSDGQNMLFYHGTVASDPSSMVALSIFEDELSLMIMDHWGTYTTVHKGNNKYVLYNNEYLRERARMSCISDELQTIKAPFVPGRKITATGDCVDIYVEMDFEMFQRQGSSIPACENYIAGLFNQASIIYANESINIAVSETLIWDTVDPYAGDDIIQKLLDFGGSIMDNYNGRLAHLLAGYEIPPGQSATAGIAWLDVLCATFFQSPQGPAGPYAVSANLETNVIPFPDYSSGLNTLTHELGHNFGSPHTHACVWNGNNTQIDDCANIEDPGNADACYNAANPILPPNDGGTIMSYCNLNQGVDLALGFGPQPGDLIRQRYNAAPCVTGTNCNGGVDIFGCTDFDAHNYNPNANMDDGSCETCDDGIQNGDETDIDCGGVLCEPCCDIAVSNLNVQSTFCSEANGSIEVITEGGNPPLEFTLDGYDYQNDNVFEDLAAGPYILEIIDIEGCTFDTNFMIEASDGLIFNVILTQTTCGLDNGVISITNVVGTPPFEISINGAQTSDELIYMDLASGDYSIEITDGEGCFLIEDAFIEMSEPIEIETEVTDSECNLAIGRIIVSPSNGTAPYTYSINNGPFQSDNNFDNLASAVYTIQVKDAMDCIETEMVNIQDISTLNVQTTPTNTDCGMANGQIQINAVGGSTPYRYSIDNGPFQSTNVFSNLAAATYTISVEDNIGCAVSSMIEILDVTTLSLDGIASATTCGEENGSFTFNASGGTPPYTYSIDGVTYIDAIVINDLAFGSYTLYVKDNIECVMTAQASVMESTALTINPEVSPVSCNGENDGSVNLQINTSNGDSQFSIDGEGFQASPIFENLSAGEHSYSVTDESNCNAIGTFSIEEPNEIIITLNLDGNEITANVTGGKAPYNYLWSDGSMEMKLTNPTDTAYAIEVEDANGCKKMQSINLSTTKTEDLLNGKSVKIYPNPNEGLVFIDIQDGNKPIEIEIIDLRGIRLFHQAAKVFERQTIHCSSWSAGTYFIKLTDSDQQLVKKLVIL